jgi:hypothetical protein
MPRETVAPENAPKISADVHYLYAAICQCVLHLCHDSFVVAPSTQAPIDKAFRIATPMLKALWTKRFAAGWGERAAADGRGERRERG